MDQLIDQKELFCQIHPQNNFIYIKLSEDCEQMFKCEECILDDSSSKEYLSINLIQKCKEDFIFKNWPPLNDCSLLNELKITSQDLKNPTQEIEYAFNNMKHEIIQKIEEKKKNSIQKAESNFVKKLAFYQVYNDLSGKDKLQKLLNLKNQDLILMNDQLKQLVKEKYSQKDQNERVLKEFLEKIKIQKSSFFISQISLIKNDILRQLNAFDHTFNQNKQLDNTLVQVENIKQQLNFLLDNKFNHLQPSFLQNFNNIFDQTSYLFSQLDISNTFKRKPIQFQMLSQQQIEELEIAASIMIESKQLNNYTFQSLPMNQLPFLTSLRRQIPLNIKNQSNLMENINSQIYGKATLSDYDQSKLIIVKEDINKQTITISKKDPSLYGGMYFKFDLIKNKKYIIRFKFDRKVGDYVMLGVINSKNLNDQLDKTFQSKIFGHICNFYCGNIVKGGDLYDPQANQIIEARIDIGSRIIQYLDYPSYQQVNQLNANRLLNSEETYYFAVHFGKNNIIMFKEVETF